MKSGYYIYKENKYIFQLEDNGNMTVMEESGPDMKKLFNNWNNFNKSTEDIQIQKVKFFPNWNEGIIFHRENLDYIGQGEKIKVFAIIEFNHLEDSINMIDIHSKELDYIYNSNRVLSKISYTKEGYTQIKLDSYKNVNSVEKSVLMEDKIIKYSWLINRKNTLGNVNVFFSINSILRFKIDNKGNNYIYIFNLIQKVQLFISYLYYRRNVSFNKIELFSEDGKKANMILFNNDNDIVSDKYLKKNFIPYKYISRIDDKIFQSIIDNNIFVRHIPKNEIERTQITPQTFISISSAFEWEFSKLFPEGVKHKKKKLQKIEDIKKDIEEISKGYSDGFKKKIIENVLINIGKDNLESKLNYAYKNLKNISEIFLETLCELNNINNFKNVFTELQKLRNDYAHGNMEINLNSDGFVGLIFLERFNYIIQMKRFGIEDKTIMKIINNLFDTNIAL